MEKDLEAMDEIMRFMNLMIVTERGYSENRDGQMDLLLEEFGNDKDLIYVMLNSFASFALFVARYTQAFPGNHSPDALFVAFRDSVIKGMEN